MSDRKPPAIFLSGSPGLDFLNSLATPVDVPIDWIDDGDGLLAWLEQARLVPTTVLKTLKNQAMPGELDGVAARARDLREWFRGFVKARSGKRLRGPRPARTRAAEPLARPRRAIRSARGRGRARGIRSKSTVADTAAMAFAGIAALADRRGDRQVPLPRGFSLCEGLRRFDLHASVRGSHPQACPAMVSHGDLRKQGQTGRPPQPAEGGPVNPSSGAELRVPETPRPALDAGLKRCLDRNHPALFPSSAGRRPGLDHRKAGIPAMRGLPWIIRSRLRIPGDPFWSPDQKRARFSELPDAP